jgi:hypothetical protein
MTDELHVRRRQQLLDAVKRAIVDLLAHERTAPGFSFPLDSTEKVWVTVKVGPSPMETS